MEEKDTKKTNKKPIIIGAVAAVVVVAVVCVLLFSNKAIRATTMRMLRMEGTVILEENGKLKEVREDLRLKSGNAVSTEDESLCSIGLDETKIVTLDENSRAEFTKKGKALNLNLTQGSLFFEVSKKLASDESFDIETTTMIVGIRGTSGLVTCDTEGHEGVICTDGTIHLTAKHPKTGEIKEIDVPAGSKVTVYIYDREVDGVMFELEPLTEEDLPDFVTDRLVENMVLLDKVVSDTGWSKPLILGEDVTVSVKEEEEEKDEETPAETLEEEDKEPEEEIEEPEEEEIVETPPQSTLPAGVVRNADGTFTLADGTVFDPDFYRNKYGDLAGMTDEELLNHYLTYGDGEDRSANQAQQDQKDAEESAKQAQQNSHDDDDSSSGLQNGDSGTGGGNGSDTGYIYDAASGDVTDADGNPLGTYEQSQTGPGGQFHVGQGTYSMPITINGNEVNISDLVINDDTLNGTSISKGSTTITKIDGAFVVDFTAADGTAKQFHADSGYEWSQGSGTYNGTTYTGLLLSCNNTQGEFLGTKCIIDDNGGVHIVPQQ